MGFVTEQQSGAYSIHPLLREFLHCKLLVMDEASRTHHLNEAMVLLLEEESWEDAFALIHRFDLRDYIEPLLTAALYDLLERGLVSTISEFVNYGRQSLEDSAVLDLATAELTFRSGFHERSLLLAESAGRSFGESSELGSRAFCRAGHAAYFLDKRIVNFSKLPDKIIPKLCRTINECFILKHIHSCNSNCTSQRVPAKCRAM